MKVEFLSEKLETMPKLLVQKAVYAANKKKRELTLKQALKVVESHYGKSRGKDQYLSKLRSMVHQEDRWRSNDHPLRAPKTGNGRGSRQGQDDGAELWNG